MTIVYDQWRFFEWGDGNGKQLGYGAKGHISCEDVIQLNDCADDETPLGTARHCYGRLEEGDDGEFEMRRCPHRVKRAIPITIVEYVWRG